MAKLTESPHAGCFLISEANGELSREEITIDESQTLLAGQVLALKANGRYAKFDHAGIAPLNAAVAVLWDAVTTGAGETAKAVAIVREAEVRIADLKWDAAFAAGDLPAALAALAVFHIIGR